MTGTSAKATGSPDQLPKHTTPTWEVELLISGVAVFAMLQLPGWLDDRIFALLPRFDREWASTLVTLYVYLKSAALVMAITFMLHLTLRAHWIALVGMHSVFPDGVRWESLRMGPAQRDSQQRRLGLPADAIERADNRATVVFAMGVMLGTVLVLISIFAAVVFGVIGGIQASTGTHFDFTLALAIAVVLIVLPRQAAHVVDRRYASHWAETSWQRRVLTRVFNGYSRIGMGRHSYVWMLLSSHAGQRRSVLIVWIIFFPVITVAALSVITLNSPNALGNYGLFPRLVNDSRAMNAAYYDDQRDAARDKAVPYIQSAVITDPYLKLVVPYQPDHDASAIRRVCAASLNLPNPHERAQSTLDCLGKLHAVTLDGKPLPDLSYQAGSDARTQRPALLAMIDVRALTPGRHELDVMRAPAAAGMTDKVDKITRYVIPFWR
ncbi:MAG: hypothetical protein ABI386_03465 [Rhodanobacter sp.]